MVFCHLSGATHRFGGAEAWVFEQLLEGPASIFDLAAAARGVADAQSEDVMLTSLGEIVSMLEGFSLVTAES